MCCSFHTSGFSSMPGADLISEGKMRPVELYINVSNICHYEDQHLSRLMALTKLNYNGSEQ